jgi:hypothetical protein
VTLHFTAMAPTGPRSYWVERRPPVENHDRYRLGAAIASGPPIQDCRLISVVTSNRCQHLAGRAIPSVVGIRWCKPLGPPLL